MVQTFETNSNNDIFLDAAGNVPISTGLEAVLEACATATKAQYQEMILAQSAGIPNFQTIWIGVPNYAIFSAYLKATIESVEGVIAMTNLTLSSKDNVLSYAAEINTIYGVDTLNG